MLFQFSHSCLKLQKAVLAQACTGPTVRHWYHCILWSQTPPASVAAVTSLALSGGRQHYLAFYSLHEKLDGVGPVDNRPSPEKLNHFVKKKKYM